MYRDHPAGRNDIFRSLMPRRGNLVDTLRDLDDAQIESLAGILPAPARDLLHRCVRDLRAAKGQPLLSTLAPALDAYWDPSLKQRIRTALIALTLDFK